MIRALYLLAIIMACAVIVTMIISCASPRPMTDGEGAAIATHIKRSGL